MKQFFICRRCGALYEFADKEYRKAPWVPFLESGGLNCILKQVPSCDCWKGQAVEPTTPSTFKIYAVIRAFEDDEPGPDLQAIGWTKQGALEKAQDIDSRLPGWAKKNPIVRVGQFEVKEVEP